MSTCCKFAFALSLFASVTIWAGDLKTFTANKKDSLTYRLRTGKCSKECKIEIALFKESKEVNSISLPIDMVSNIKSVSKKERAGVFVWESRVGESTIELTIKTLHLDPEHMGLLVTLEGGFEHVHRYHRLYATNAGKLAELWKGDENFAGPESSNVDVFKLKNSSPSEGFYRIYSFIYSDGETDTAERWEINFYKLSKSGKIEISKDDHPVVYGAIIGSFPKVKDAEVYRSSLQTEKYCVSSFQILASSNFKKLKPGLIIVAQPDLIQFEAQDALKKATKCNPKIKGYVKVFQ